MNVSRPIELLAPAKTADIGIEAVLHGAEPCISAVLVSVRERRRQTV